MAEIEKFKVNKHKNNLNRRIVIRTTEEMADNLFQIAQDNNVSVNNLVLSCIEYALENKE